MLLRKECPLRLLFLFRPRALSLILVGLAEYRLQHGGLQRVLGTGALFSTAYGNVGSSIYYATAARLAGRRIVEEAREIRARALVMSLPPRRTGMSLFGKTLETVLADRPCRVIIESSRGVETARRAA